MNAPSQTPLEHLQRCFNAYREAANPANSPTGAKERIALLSLLAALDMAFPPPPPVIPIAPPTKEEIQEMISSLKTSYPKLAAIAIRLAATKDSTRWIPIDERTPVLGVDTLPHSNYVLGATVRDPDEVVIVYYDPNVPFVPWRRAGYGDEAAITHWRPIPPGVFPPSTTPKNLPMGP